MLKKQKKSKVIEEFQVHGTDTGSPEVQAAILTAQIKKLTLHLKKHAKDNHSRFGLLKMVAKRKKLVDYLSKEDPERHKKLLKKLELKK
ncbi:30S ribosomal protein S15 [Patescibacteria group bacterium]|nr:30S ribosomal protein S15 [Patescibacteria group bacterium]MBU2220206.1 30S ribosomal protein S15 [Patescibacteria group bacterium]MBU2265152.1 30S ribosomal protein S15 [Patescibacteria group bacterium]